jgi:hypothetical protein
MVVILVIVLVAVLVFVLTPVIGHYRRRAQSQGGRQAKYWQKTSAHELSTSRNVSLLPALDHVSVAQIGIITEVPLQNGGWH